MVEGETGFMSPVGDIASMSQQALQILQSDETLRQFRERASAHAKKFDIHHIVPLYEKLYKRFL
jgi:glycosyltransferase involved in cell wall biosynthesis